MLPTRMRRSSKTVFFVLAALWLAGVPVVSAQSVTDVPPAPAPVAAGAPSDTLLDALTCRTANGDLATLLQRLRRERPTEFTQTERQFSAPMMDLYRLAEPVQAWGHHSDAVVITDNRVLLLVDDSIEQASAGSASSNTPGMRYSQPINVRCLRPGCSPG